MALKAEPDAQEGGLREGVEEVSGSGLKAVVKDCLITELLRIA